MAKKLRFQCQMSGRCCVSRGEYGFVYLTEKDCKRLAKSFRTDVMDFKKNYCQFTDGFLHLLELPNRKECIFLEGKKCSVYKSRPEQCRTWPFWDENISSRGWSRRVQKECPGIGKGPTFSTEDVRKRRMAQKEADESVVTVKDSKGQKLPNHR